MTTALNASAAHGPVLKGSANIQKVYEKLRKSRAFDGEDEDSSGEDTIKPAPVKRKRENTKNLTTCSSVAEGAAASNLSAKIPRSTARYRPNSGFFPGGSQTKADR